MTYLANQSRQMPVGTYDNKELAYYLLSERIADDLPEGAKTVNQLYERIGRKLRLPKQDFKEVVNNAVKAGYIIKL